MTDTFRAEDSAGLLTGQPIKVAPLTLWVCVMKKDEAGCQPSTLVGGEFLLRPESRAPRVRLPKDARPWGDELGCRGAMLRRSEPNLRVISSPVGPFHGQICPAPSPDCRSLEALEHPLVKPSGSSSPNGGKYCLGKAFVCSSQWCCRASTTSPWR
jgi:hypothetical protein